MKRSPRNFSAEAPGSRRRGKREINTWFHMAFCAAILLVVSTGNAGAGTRVVRSLLEARHENVLMQEWDLSCGAAALTTLLNYQHGDQVTEKEVANALMRREEYVRNPLLIKSRDGFSLADLKRYVDARGPKRSWRRRPVSPNLFRRPCCN